MTDFILKSLEKQNKAQASSFNNTSMMPIYVSGFNDNALNFLANNLKYKNMTPYNTGNLSVLLWEIKIVISSKTQL